MRRIWKIGEKAARSQGKTVVYRTSEDLPDWAKKIDPENLVIMDNLPGSFNTDSGKAMVKAAETTDEARARKG